MLLVINYIEDIESRRVMSAVEPGYLKKLLPDTPPEDGEHWEDIQKDVATKIMPGMTHWSVIRPVLPHNGSDLQC